MFAYYIHQLSPYIFRIHGDFGARWYGFAYVMAFLIGFYVYRWLAQRGYGPLRPEQVGDFITVCAIFGVLLGGRLGWIIFYGLDEIWANPWNAFNTLGGGMSSHGGMLGVLLASFIYARWNRVSWVAIGDNLVVVVPIGLFLGRLANFINGELWGRVIPGLTPGGTGPWWAVQFPNELLHDSPAAAQLVAAGYAHDPAALHALGQLLPPRYPSQLIEAFLEGIVLFVLMWVMRTRARAPVGTLTGVFFIAYALVRILGEQFREPDVGIPLTHGLTRGQFLSLFLILIGIAFLIYAFRTRRPTPAPGDKIP